MGKLFICKLCGQEYTLDNDKKDTNPNARICCNCDIIKNFKWEISRIKSYIEEDFKIKEGFTYFIEIIYEYEQIIWMYRTNFRL